MNLQPLDVILIEGIRGDIADEIIMAASGHRWTHTVVAKDAKGNVWDATLGGILDHNIDFYNGRYKTVCRFCDPLSSVDVSNISSWIKEKQSSCKGYDAIAWLGFGTGIKFLEDEDRWYCSELPYWMFQDNGFRLTGKDLSFIYPTFFLWDERWIKRGLFETILWEEIEIEGR